MKMSFTLSEIKNVLSEVKEKDFTNNESYNNFDIDVIENLQSGYLTCYKNFETALRTLLEQKRDEV